MKKTIITIVMLLVFCLNILAGDGDMPTGNKNCTQNCFVGNIDNQNNEIEKEDSLYEYLKNLISDIL